MKFAYYADTDSLYIDLTDKESASSREISEGIVLDYDREGKVVGIDISHASQIANLSSLEVSGLLGQA